MAERPQLTEELETLCQRWQADNRNAMGHEGRGRVMNYHRRQAKRDRKFTVLLTHEESLWLDKLALEDGVSKGHIVRKLVKDAAIAVCIAKGVAIE